jgi:ATP-dependent DNA ligase
MLHFSEVATEKAEVLRDVVIQEKIDGFRAIWWNNHLYSERRIIQDEKFPHIYSELFAHFNNCFLDGEIAVSENSSVWDITSKVNWGKATYFVFDILMTDKNSFLADGYQKRLSILKDCLYKLGGLKHIKLVKEYQDFQTALRDVKERNLEGIILRNVNQTYNSIIFGLNIFSEQKYSKCLKWKNWKEEVVEIVGYEGGSEKGAFLLANGGRISALSKTIAEQYQELRQMGKKIMLEVEYLKKTKNNILFQPKPKRFLLDGEKVEFR